MTDHDSDALRHLVREVLHDLVPDRVPDPSTEVGASPAPRTSQPPAGALVHDGATGSTTTDTAVAGGRVEPVAMGTDADLQRFVTRLLQLAENPKHRADLVSGRLRFQLDAQPETATPSLRFVEKGAVTEAQVKDAARAGVGLRLSRRAVLTPLARDQARALGVVVEKEA